MMHVVQKPFRCRRDAGDLHGEELVPGDRRDFGDMAEGLLREGYIAEAEVSSGTGPIDIPGDWAAGNADAVKALAAALTGEPVKTRAEAEAIIKAEIERRTAGPAA